MAARHPLKNATLDVLKTGQPGQFSFSFAPINNVERYRHGTFLSTVLKTVLPGSHIGAWLASLASFGLRNVGSVKSTNEVNVLIKKLIQDPDSCCRKEKTCPLSLSLSPLPRCVSFRYRREKQLSAAIYTKTLTCHRCEESREMCFEFGCFVLSS